MWTDIRELHWDSETKSSRREMRRGKKKTKKLLDKTRLFQTISQPRIYLQTDFFFLSKDHQIIIKRTWTSYIFMLQSSRSVCLF